MGPYRAAVEIPVEEEVYETPEAILFDTLKRLNAIGEDDAQRVVRGLAAFCGFSVGRWERSEEAGFVDMGVRDGGGE
jgi:hypothetical protein